MKTTSKIATVSALAFVLALPALTPAQARHHHRHHVHHYAKHVRQVHYRDYGRWNERACTRSPSSANYEPCMNRP